MITGAPALAGWLGTVCDTWRELDPTHDSELAVDGVMPTYWCGPGCAEELGAILRLASEVGASVIPRGGGTRLTIGRPPRSADLLLSTRRLNQVIEYEPSDLTITAGAGLLLGDLQRQLGRQGQFLALDPPCADQATIGGAV